MSNKIVFILGSGFTRAFSKDAPLLDWDMSELIQILKEKYKKFPNIKRILFNLKTDTSKRINIETVLSRLYAGMPYDGEFLPDGERKILYEDIYKYFLKVLSEVKVDEEEKETLSQFAKFVVEKGITCITFNYDTVLDKALWDYKKSGSIIEEKYWHPDGGYGFFCRPANLLISEGENIRKDRSNWLLKLHGSLNWKIRRGFQKPYPLDSLIHEEDWMGKLVITPEDMLIHREAMPFVIPPVLDKTALSDQPILKVVWENAYKKLSQSDKVVFIGYSLPKTDIAASFLFTDALKSTNRKNIFVINIKGKEEEKEKSYKELFPSISESQFSFEGASTWIKSNCII